MKLKRILMPIYYLLKNRNYREFWKIYIRYGKYERFKKVNDVKFLEYKIDVPDLPSFIWQFKEIFVDEIYKFHSDSYEPVIFDCGANIGMMCLYFKRIYPKARILAFEADPIIASILKSNLLKNGINDVEIINKAVWINYDGVEFGIEGADGGSIYLDKNRIKVESIRLRDYIENEERIDLLKIDIEGAEYEVLQDCKSSLTNVKNIFVEYHSYVNANQKLSEILKIFEENGFRYYIESIGKVKSPFVSNRKERVMDLQLNIFATKDG